MKPFLLCSVVVKWEEYNWEERFKDKLQTHVRKIRDAAAHLRKLCASIDRFWLLEHTTAIFR